MDKIKALHAAAGEILWNIGLKKALITGKKETLKAYKPLMVDTNYIDKAINELKVEIHTLKAQYSDCLELLEGLITKL